jgi:hypothetical protein
MVRYTYEHTFLYIERGRWKKWQKRSEFIGMAGIYYLPNQGRHLPNTRNRRRRIIKISRRR